MGKLKRSTINKNQNKGKKKSVKLTLQNLIERAEDCLDQFQLEDAYKYAKQALDMEPNNIKALDVMAAVQVEMGNVESARNVYKKLIELAPNEGFNKYMCIAQMSSGLEAVQFYLKGIEIMMSEYEKQEAQPSTSAAAVNDGEQMGITKSDISTAFGSLAELYLTDLCMEENAAQICKGYLDKSLEFDSENPESLQLLASYWLSEDNIEEAKSAIIKSVNIWVPKYKAADEEGLIDPAQVIGLSYDSRLNTSRILTEVEEYDHAIVVLEHLLDEDDEVVYVWYMMGLVNDSKGDDYKSNAKYYLKKADELATKIKYEQKYLDDDLKSHIKELLQKLADIPSDDEDDKENEDDADADDEDLDDEDDDEDDEDDDDEEDEEEDDTEEEEEVNQKMKTSSIANKMVKAKTESAKKIKNKKNNAAEPMEIT